MIIPDSKDKDFYTNFHKYITVNGKKIKLVVSHIDNEDLKAYVCVLKEDQRDNFGNKLKEGGKYVCTFPPTKRISHSYIGDGIGASGGVGCLVRNYEYLLNKFEYVDLYNKGVKMAKDQNVFAPPIEFNEVDIIAEVKWRYDEVDFKPRKDAEKILNIDNHEVLFGWSEAEKLENFDCYRIRARLFYEGFNRYEQFYADTEDKDAVENALKIDDLDEKWRKLYDIVSDVINAKVANWINQNKK
jgi:hypothetical protein